MEINVQAVVWLVILVVLLAVEAVTLGLPRKKGQKRREFPRDRIFMSISMSPTVPSITE